MPRRGHRGRGALVKPRPEFGYGPGTIGVPVVESPLIAYDEMYISGIENAIVVGELAHFKYRLEQNRRNDALRARLTKNLQDWAEKLLGEPWTVGGK